MELNEKELSLIINILKTTLNKDYYLEETKEELKSSINKLKKQQALKKYK